MAHFGRGSRGLLITPLRAFFALLTSADPAFDEFDAVLEDAVKALQVSQGKTPTGVVDEQLYQFIAHQPFPSQFDRALMAIASIEGHGYFKTITADRRKDDPAGITAGIIGFTAKSGSLGEVLQKIDATVIDQALAHNGLTGQKTALDH